MYYLILLTALLLTSCATNLVVCKNWNPTAEGNLGICEYVKTK